MVLARQVIAILLLTVCATAQTTDKTVEPTKCDGAPSRCWLKVDAGPFAILAPVGWKFEQLTGVDSFVGEFVGNDMALTFDFGRYSTELRNVKKPEYIITKKLIDGHTAKVVHPQTSGNGITGVHIHLKHHDALCLWGKDLTRTQEELALKIFETIRFGGPMPPSVIPPPPPPPATKVN